MENDRILINKGWLFAKTSDPDAVKAGYSEDGFMRVNLPHDWQVLNPQTQDAPGGGSQGYFPREEIGVYRLHITPDKAWRGKLVRVLFDGVQRFCEIYLNGELIGGRKYGYVPILAELKNLKYESDNLLAVRVDNACARDKSIAGGDRWYSGAGIYRNVHLLVDEHAHIRHDGIFVVSTPVIAGPGGDVAEEKYIKAKRADVRAEIETEGDTHGSELQISVTLGRKAVYAANVPAQALNVCEFSIGEPVLWQLGAPALYTLTARLTRDGRVTDEQSVRFGIRSAVFDSEDGFILNGVRTKLWGLNFHHDGGPFGAAVPVEIWRRRLESAKRLGVNAVRTSHNPMAEEFYDLCDELGLLVIDEYCDKWQHSGMYFDLIDDAERLEEIEIMLRRDRNHPSVILWSVGNEIGVQYSEYFYSTLEKLCAKVRSLDPTRGVSAALIGFVLSGYNDMTPMGVKMQAVRRYAEIVDVFMGNYMEQLYVKMRECGMRKPIIGSEVCTYHRFSEKSMNTTDISPESPYAIVKRYPWVAGAFVWAGCDYLGEAGWPSRGWTGDPLDSAAFPKIRAWYCAAQFKTEPVLKLAVYDESEPWDRARGMWGFPQMRAHWKYGEWEKVMHVAVMTNCDTVRLYQNNQSVRTARLSDFPDGMIHFYLTYNAGTLRAAGYMNGVKVAEDVLREDYAPSEFVLKADTASLPADGRSVALVEALINDAYGNPYVLSEPDVQVSAEGAGEIACLDNGNALRARDYHDNTHLPVHNGHLLIAVRAGEKPGSCTLRVKTDGFDEQTLTINVI